MKNYLAEKQNKSELETMLQQKFGDTWQDTMKLVYDKTEGRYKVEETETEEEKNIDEEESERAVLKEKIKVNTKDYHIIDQKILQGKIYIKIKHKQNGYWTIMDEKGYQLRPFHDKVGSFYDEVGDYTDIGGKIVFAAKE